jgi:hypothetical protein
VKNSETDSPLVACSICGKENREGYCETHDARSHLIHDVWDRLRHGAPVPNPLVEALLRAYERQCARASRIAMLEAVLRPFAEAVSLVEAVAYEPDNLTQLGRCNWDGLTLGDLRRSARGH